MYSMNKQEKARGSILIAVLAIIVLISFFAMRFLEETVRQLEYYALFQPGLEERELAYGYLEAALAVIQEVALIDEGRIHAPEQGWGDPLAYPGFPPHDPAQVSIRIEDQSGRLPLHSMDEALLRALFEEMELPYGTVRELSDSLLDWIDPDDERRLSGAETSEYLSGAIPYRAANGPIQSFEELRLINGFKETFFDPETGRPNEFFRMFTEAVSLVSLDPVNLNSAPDIVLRTLARIEGFDTQSLWDGLDLPYRTVLPGNVSGRLASVETSLLRVTVEMRRGDSPFTVSALISPRLASATNAARSELPGESIRDAEPREGTAEEQAAVQYPFQVLRLSETYGGSPVPSSARNSDIDRMRSF